MAKNLSTKIANALYWTGKHCPGVRHIVKVDEDTYVHLPQLVSMVRRVEKVTPSFVLGHQHKHHYPKVVRRGRWRVGLEYPLPYYPRYIYGHSYVISGAALPSILHTLRTTPGIKNEDAFVTGIVAKLNNIPRLHSRAFAGTSYQQVLCNVTRGYYVSLTYCCKEHLKTLYRHAVEGRCDESRFDQIPTWKCRFFSHSHSRYHNNHQHQQHQQADTAREPRRRRVTALDVKKLEQLLNVGAAAQRRIGQEIL
ncbi:beta-1,3-galactosyltransferase 1-like [Elysia marginata]|uniref:Hexosyltransferase n=1 Tax=Elysia marginata TaxID=1093978 RepID=A0AAV4EUY5_9GAST|nr:beta-1,3-galactosyltransferase 1-like [Elysia marginata]